MNYLVAFTVIDLANGLPAYVNKINAIFNNLSSIFDRSLLISRFHDGLRVLELKKGSESANVIKINKNLLLRIPYLKGLFMRKSLYNELERIILSSNKEDQKVLYIRFAYPDLWLLKTLQKAKSSNYFVILDIPTFPYRHEFSLSFKGIFFRICDLIFVKNARKYVDLIISPHNDSLVLGIKNVRYSNGVDISNIKVKSYVYGDNDVINIISVSSLQKWHGYDRVIKGLANYYKKNPEKKVYFHVVGDGPELPKLKRLTRKLNVEDFVVFHGVKTGKDLDELFDICHVAVGSLGMHRIKLIKGSVLKSREYCARGIPFIIGYEDPDFPQSFKYIFRVPADESPIDIDAIVTFYESIKNENYTLEMRKYAEEYLVWSVKLKPVIEAIKKMLEEKGKSQTKSLMGSAIEE